MVIQDFGSAYLGYLTVFRDESCSSRVGMASAVGRGGSTELRTGARSIGLGVVYLRALRETVAALRDAGVASSSSFDVRERERGFLVS